MRIPLRSLRLLPASLPALALAALCAGCQPLLPAGGEIPLRDYQDTLLRVDIGYPEGWSLSEKTWHGADGMVHDLYCEPPRTEWTRRFTVKVKAPERVPEGRTLEDLKAELLERLARAPGPVRVDDTLAAVLGGERAFEVRYTTFLDGKPFVRHADRVCLRAGRDVALSFEVADARAEADILLYRRVAERFRFLPDRP